MFARKRAEKREKEKCNTPDEMWVIKFHIVNKRYASSLRSTYNTPGKCLSREAGARWDIIIHISNTPQKYENFFTRRLFSMGPKILKRFHSTKHNKDFSSPSFDSAKKSQTLSQGWMMMISGDDNGSTPKNRRKRYYISGASLSFAGSFHCFSPLLCSLCV